VILVPSFPETEIGTAPNTVVKAISGAGTSPGGGRTREGVHPLAPLPAVTV